MVASNNDTIVLYLLLEIVALPIAYLYNHHNCKCRTIRDRIEEILWGGDSKVGSNELINEAGEKLRKKMIKIKAEWDVNGYSWKISVEGSEVLYFDVVEGEDKFCRGAIIDLSPRLKN